MKKIKTFFFVFKDVTLLALVVKKKLSDEYVKIWKKSTVVHSKRLHLLRLSSYRRILCSV